LPDVEYLDGFCDGINEALSLAGHDMHLMVFHPDYDAKEAGLDFLVDDGVTDKNLSYCMVFVQKLSLLDDAAMSLAKSGYYKHFPDDIEKVKDFQIFLTVYHPLQKRRCNLKKTVGLIKLLLFYLK
jgi:hypothetical protein